MKHFRIRMKHSRWIRSALTLFTVIYGFSAALWALPLPKTPALESIRETWVRPVLKSLSLYQNWGMFAPDPLTLDRSMEAHVTLSSGQTLRYLLPAERRGWIVERIRGEQLRKWSLDHLRLDQNRAFWPGAARYYAALAQKEAQSPTATVKLIRHWSRKVTPPPTHYFPSLELPPTDLASVSPELRYTPGMEPRTGGTPRPVFPGKLWMSYTFYTEQFPSNEAPQP